MHFTLDIKVKKTLIKLPILTNDSIADINDRLCQLSSTPSHKKASMAEKLTKQLQLLLESAISEKAKIKLRSLLDIKSSKNDADEEANRSSEGNFEILQRSIENAKHNIEFNQRKSYKYLQNGPELKIKYSSDVFEETLNNASPLRMKNVLKSPKRIINSTSDQEISTNYIQKYQALDKKCDQYITKNIQRNYQKKFYEPIRNTNSPYTHRIQSSYNLDHLASKNCSPNEVDRKFSQLNLYHLKYVEEQTDLTHYHSQTQRNQTILPLPLPFQPLERRFGRKYNYLTHDS